MQQESINFLDFMERFQTEEQYREFLFKLRWPTGFVCPKCGHTSYYEIKNRHLYNCGKCGHQASGYRKHDFPREPHTPDQMVCGYFHDG
jgi:ribosomal protein L37AE/L43A